MRQSPRHRRLCSDETSLRQLKAASSIFDYTPHVRQGPPEVYLLSFRGRGLCRPEGCPDAVICEYHQVLVRLGAAYPRQMPELVWKTPIYHPNISSNGVVCLGGYSTYWVPSLRLDQLCEMLWNMIRYENYDVESPYNREAAQWVRTQTKYAFPVDPRPLRSQCPMDDRGADVLEVVEAELVLEAVELAEPPEILYIE